MAHRVDTLIMASEIYAVGGGKGGVGKSVFAVVLATVMAGSGRRVALVDLDLGAANLHTYLGLTRKTATLAAFLRREVASLDELLLNTPVANLQLISGADAPPGTANPAHWMKLKLIRHIRALPVDVVVADLGAGVNFNTLDFFGMADQGIVLTAPEPAAVMNAYGFLKSVLFRQLERVFRRHPALAPVIAAHARETDDDTVATLESLERAIGAADPEALPLVSEVKQAFKPALVVNRAPPGPTPEIVRNLLALSRDRLGLALAPVGSLPEVADMGRYLLRIHALADVPAGANFITAARHIAGELGAALKLRDPDAHGPWGDEQVQAVLDLIDRLDPQIFGDTRPESWKLRMYFKPAEVLRFLASRGVDPEALHAGGD